MEGRGPETDKHLPQSPFTSNKSMTVTYGKLIDPEVYPIAHTQKVKVFSAEQKPRTYSMYIGG
jgi:hypothetical protein